MKKSRLNCTKTSIASTAMLAAVLINASSFGKTDVPVFLLSGQ